MTILTPKAYDLVVVGAGIVGLACAYQAFKRGLKVAVLERNAKCVGASIRNFGFVTVTGQRPGDHWRRARESRDVWLEVAGNAGIPVLHRGLYLAAQRQEAKVVLEAFLQTEMAEQCRWLSAKEQRELLPFVKNMQAVLFSPLECRVESREAIGQLAHWLESACGVDFYWKTAVTSIDLPHVVTANGKVRTSYCIACPGHDLYSLFPNLQQQAGIRMSTLQMLRLVPAMPIKLPGAIMSDLSLVRYEGYSGLPQAQALLRRLQVEQPDHLKQGVHLIVVQSADGSLVVGDSHVYDDAEDPFASQARDELILQEFERVINCSGSKITERWVGTYASADDVVHCVSPIPGAAIGIVTGGTGASTAFAFARELVDTVLHSS
ncbi:MAG: TIGR03364 family FAD-dependent oxidoreductase [Burkholderiaceae bacterium]|nr:TIGR03364 family FAD-dependent oxidoreductase [Burkholderiaceae bacterium]MCD8517779.1 TIGR03364 family FAD-dependent oxidoreductase [Burkholderiaceae bacterium]MCD8537460.1 TIGR03364 family FAD-dependent oxidoreductase [Burkholderiaceae bacterium]MCD8564211.1 TIGR03364 family FAD-dependent oxidoreductase [Burkholderiaceae bacterium]